MRLMAVSVLSLGLAIPAAAQLTQASAVSAGGAVPIVADVNGDGLDDLIQDKKIILNTGAGPADVRVLGLREMERVIAVLDVNGDHIVDLMTVETGVATPPSLGQQDVRRDPFYRLYIGDAARTYSKSIDIASGPQPYVADVDGDGKDDILLMTYIWRGVQAVAEDVTVLRSRGDGTFDRLEPFRIPPDPQMLSEFRVPTGDINHDGLPDLVFRTPYDLVILRGTGGGKFAVEQRYVPQDLSYGWWVTRMADIDGDGNLDIIMAGQRRIRAFLGDGHGNFPRMTTTTIAKLHDAQGYPAGLPLKIDELNQPRSIAVGHFTRADPMQIVAGMGEGDLVVLAWEQGSLKDVSRTQTELWLPDLRPGSFHRNGLDDLYVIGTVVWGYPTQYPRLFYGAAENVSLDKSPASGPVRGRVSRTATPRSTSMEIQAFGDCVDSVAQRWVFKRDGVFGSSERDGNTMEAIFDAPSIYFRMRVPNSSYPIMGVLTNTNGTYSGTAQVETACGWKQMTVTAKVD